MSSSAFTQRWTSVNDLTTNNNNNNNQLTSFFLQSSDPNTFSITLRPSQSLASLVEPTLYPSSSPPPPIPPRSSEQIKGSSSRVADMIHRFESHTKLSLKNNSNKSSPPIRNVFTKQWEENSSRTTSVVIVKTTTPTNSKENNKRQPIIVCERITNHDRSHKSLPTPPPVSPKSPLAKKWLQNKIKTQKSIESDTDSAIQTMAIVINNDTNDSTILSRSNTTESSCSSSSSSISPSTPHFILPTNASTQKQCDITTNSTSFKRTCSPPPSPPSSVTTFCRPIPSTHHENFESLLPPTRLYASEINLVDQYRRLSSSSDVTRSDIDLTQNSPTKTLINTNLPLKYKRDTFIRLYG